MEIALTFLGGTAFAAIISGIFNLINKTIDRKYAKEDNNNELEGRIDNIEAQVKRSEVDNVRLQMMVLMSDYPDDEAEMLRVAEHYFVDLRGNWYMTTMFMAWLKKRNIPVPTWFIEKMGAENDVG